MPLSSLELNFYSHSMIRALSVQKPGREPLENLGELALMPRTSERSLKEEPEFEAIEEASLATIPTTSHQSSLECVPCRYKGITN